LAARLGSGSARFAVGEPTKPLVIVTPSEREVEIGSQQPVAFTLRLESPAAEGALVRELRLLAPAANHPVKAQQPLVLTVRWTALPAKVEVPKSSGPKASGTGPT